MDFELTEGQRMLRDTVARFVDKQVIPLAPVLDEKERFPEENFKAMADMGLFGISVPEEHGGGGADLLSCALVMEQLYPSSRAVNDVPVIVRHPDGIGAGIRSDLFVNHTDVSGLILPAGITMPHRVRQYP